MGGQVSRSFTSMDRTIVCRDCGQEFTFTAGEQAFYQERGYSDPQRCPSCRAARKAQRTGGGYGDDRGYSSGPRQMFAAICSDCGRETEVPFQPTAGKPVYCRECFQNHRPSRPAYSSY
jgi:CxxC-x17-CxxC domain-containing protein